MGEGGRGGLLQEGNTAAATGLRKTLVMMALMAAHMHPLPLNQSPLTSCAALGTRSDCDVLYMAWLARCWVWVLMSW
jgi:hypothetical protein